MANRTRQHLGLLAAAVLLLAAACGKDGRVPEEAAPVRSASLAGESESKDAGLSGVPSERATNEPVLIAEGTAERPVNGERVTVRVWMAGGKEVTDPSPGPSEGTFLQGRFEATAAGADGTEWTRFGLNDAFDGEDMSFRKDSPFPIFFDDYNEDGNPDFTIAQWGGSNGNFYAMLSIGPDGIYLLDRNLYSADHRSSIRYRKAGHRAFINVYYDQEKGYMDVVHRWKDGAFVPDAPIQAKKVRPAGMEDGEQMETPSRAESPAG
ncbi:hypothetical protein GE107_01820 [Cohnella sp. CFH 77786]|uniref:hypothetical protein n=1 Tax=Cohnella sp. CFH 77786 TaxID=2662265 RepID=UPI001C60C3E0|nr:hypothetical protein [Cohnella sp. CFH 77786]MBW5444801.1 hypothetical protein [Cohnella sp. CFH 77786]